MYKIFMRINKKVSPVNCEVMVDLKNIVQMSVFMCKNLWMNEAKVYNKMFDLVQSFQFLKGEVTNIGC